MITYYIKYGGDSNACSTFYYVQIGVSVILLLTQLITRYEQSADASFKQSLIANMRFSLLILHLLDKLDPSFELHCQDTTSEFQYCIVTLPKIFSRYGDKSYGKSNFLKYMQNHVGLEASQSPIDRAAIVTGQTFE